MRFDETLRLFRIGGVMVCVVVACGCLRCEIMTHCEDDLWALLRGTGRASMFDVPVYVFEVILLPAWSRCINAF